MKYIKRLLLILAIFLVLIIGLLAAVPYFFKEDIVRAVKETINESIDADVDFEDVNLSLFRSFPDFNFQLKNYSVQGKNDFKDIQLLKGESFDITIDFMSVLKSTNEPVALKKIHLEKPEIHLLILPDGRANYNITQGSTGENNSATPALQVDLQQYSIASGTLIYDDRRGNTYLSINDLNHIGDGDFTLDVFDLETTTSIDKLTFSSNGISYLKEARTQLDAGFNINLVESKYTFKENSLKLNDLTIETDGWLTVLGDAIDMDLNFRAPQNDFKHLLSMIPNAYIEGYERVKANGSFSLNGFAKGTYSSQPEQFPSFKINLDIKNGDIQYPDSPLPVSDINANVLVHSPTSNLDDLLLDVSKFNIQVGDSPFGGYFKLKTPITDPDIDTQIKGDLDLAAIHKALPMEGVTQLTGKIAADIRTKTRMSTIDREEYEKVQMSGNLEASNITYTTTDFPPIEISHTKATLNPRAVTIQEFEGQLGKSDVKATGEIKNILAYIAPDP